MDETRLLHDELTGALVGVARAIENNMDKRTEETDRLILEGLSAASITADTGREMLSALLTRVHAEKFRIVPDCSVCQNPCGHNDDYDLKNMKSADADVRSIKSLILLGISTLADLTTHGKVCEPSDPDPNILFYRVLCQIGDDSLGTEELLPLALEIGDRITGR